MTQNYQLHWGDNLATLKNYPADHFDSIVTDPPYGIDFLGKEWDSHTGTLDLYKECLRVLKPGGYILAFSAARTYHQLATSIEQAGFEIRDQIMWLYSSGFPKAQDIGKAIQKRLGVEETKEYKTNPPRNGGSQTGEAYEMSKQETIVTSPLAKEWEGYKTSLKPAHEPIVMARKPFKGSSIDQVLKNGLSALNIDATRVPWADETDTENFKSQQFNNLLADARGIEKMPSPKKKKSDKPRPQKKNGVVGGIGVLGIHKQYIPATDDAPLIESHDSGRFPSNVIGEVEGYQKYFYCPKVSRKERHVGFELPAPMFGNVKGCYDENGNRFAVGLDARANNKSTGDVGNNHPTVKPVALMEYLIKMVTPPSTPTEQRKVLDPFMGSGSTGMAATKLGHHFTGCELDEKYIKIADTRIKAWNDSGLPEDLFGDEE